MVRYDLSKSLLVKMRSTCSWSPVTSLTNRRRHLSFEASSETRNGDGPGLGEDHDLREARRASLQRQNEPARERDTFLELSRKCKGVAEEEGGRRDGHAGDGSRAQTVIERCEEQDDRRRSQEEQKKHLELLSSRRRVLGEGRRATARRGMRQLYIHCPRLIAPCAALPDVGHRDPGLYSVSPLSAAGRSSRV